MVGLAAAEVEGRMWWVWAGAEVGAVDERGTIVGRTREGWDCGGGAA